MNRKHILDCPEAVKFISKFNLKRLVMGRGHDCGGLIADLCMGSVVLAEYHDDGWGGQPEIVFRTEVNQLLFESLLKVSNFKELLFTDGGYDFYKTVDKIDIQTQIEALVTALAELKERNKLLKKCEKMFIIGNHHSQYSVSWPKIKNLKEVPQSMLQKTYDHYKGKLKTGDKFLNTDEQLKCLGIKL